jgi:hypothetical protein
MAQPNAKQRAGAYAMIAKYGAGHAPQAMRDARWQKFLNEVDPQGLLDAAERNQRAEALQKSKMILMSQKGVAARQRKAQEKANSAIHLIAESDAGCAWCGPLTKTQTHRTCQRHAEEFKNQWK